MLIIDVAVRFPRPYDQHGEAIAPIAARQRGACVLVLHHANTLAPEDPTDSGSGTNRDMETYQTMCCERLGHDVELIRDEEHAQNIFRHGNFRFATPHRLGAREMAQLGLLRQGFEAWIAWVHASAKETTDR